MADVDELSGFGPLSFEVDCLGERHRLVWEEGVVRALDHDDHPEDILTAFGGEPTPCMMLVALAREPMRSRGSLSFINLLAPEGYHRQMAEQTERTLRQLRTGPLASRLASQYRQLRQMQLSAQAPPMVRALIHLHKAFSAPQPPDRARDASVRQLVTEAVRSTAPGDEVALRVEVVRDTKTPHMLGWSSGGRTAIAVYVQPSWIKVAEEGAAVVDGRFLVRLNAPTTRRARAGQAVRWTDVDGGQLARVEPVKVLWDESAAWTLR